jgi:hypothetical protein
MRPMGRTRKYQSNRERQKAYRLRKHRKKFMLPEETESKPTEGPEVSLDFVAACKEIEEMMKRRAALWRRLP